MVGEMAIESSSWNNARRRLPVKEHRQLPDAKTAKERDSSLETTEGTSPALTLTSAQ